MNDKIKTILAGIDGLEKRTKNSGCGIVFQNGQNRAYTLVRELIYQQFPELQESEDEKIRKEIILFFKDLSNNKIRSTASGDFAKWTEFLEKQKEQKSIKDNEETEYIRTIKYIISNFLRDKNEIDREYYHRIYDWLDGRRHIESKPAEWSEEDNDAFRRVLELLAFYEEETRQSPALSDGDKEIIRWCEKGKKWLSDRFKSFRPQPIFKPSKVQMEALMYATGEGGTYNKEALKSLLNDLQKLL